MEKWFIRNKHGDIDNISNKFGISKIMAKLLINRGINTDEKIKNYLDFSLERLHDPYLMKDLDGATNLIKNSIDNNEHIRIIGDYDQDGNSSIITLIKGIKKCGGNPSYGIPHRIKDGYGINLDIVEKCKKDGVDLIITCDNGITAFEAVEHAKKLGMKIIVTDHHDIVKEDGKEVIPSADYVLNPNQFKCNYPYKYLCGAGVAFKLIQGLYFKFNIDINESYELLEYVCMGTVCDVVDLTDENRIIVDKGLKLLNKSENKGIKALIKIADLEDKEINTYTLGYIIGPCINASGRLESAELGVELFLSDSDEKAYQYAKKLFDLNEERKRMTEDGLELVVDKIEKYNINTRKVIVVFEPTIHESIAGIIAGRIKDKYYRPTIILTNSSIDGIAKGSARSIEGYNMYEKIYELKNLLLKFGGHPMAAGLSMEINNIKEFSELIDENSELTKENLIPNRYMDMHLPIDFLTYSFVDELKILEPYGKANEKPSFADKNLKLKKVMVLGKNKNVLKLELISKKMNVITAMCFSNIDNFVNYYIQKYSDIEWEKALRGLDNSIVMDIVYYPNINEFRGEKTLQIIIQSYR